MDIPKSDKRKPKLFDLLMKNGVYGEFLIKNTTIKSFLNDYFQILNNIGFKTKSYYSTNDEARHVAILGDKLIAFLMKLIPGGKLTPDGMRHGVELDLIRCDKDIGLRLFVVPYCELFDSQELFPITQRVLERIMDNRYSHEIWNQIFKGFSDKGIELIPGITEEFKKTISESPFTYYPQAKAYDYSQNTFCPKCNYEFTAILMLKSKKQKSAQTSCPKCHHKFRIKINVKPQKVKEDC